MIETADIFADLFFKKLIFVRLSDAQEGSFHLEPHSSHHGTHLCPVCVCVW